MASKKWSPSTRPARPCWTMLKKGSSALKAAYLGSVIISLQVCRCAVPKRLRRRRNEQTNCDKCRSCAADTRPQCREQLDTPHPSHVNASRRRPMYIWFRINPNRRGSECVRRTPDALVPTVQHVSIDHRRRHVFVTQQFRTDISC